MVVETPNYSAPPPGMASHHQTNIMIPKFPPATAPAAPATGPPVIGPDGQPAWI